MRFESAKEIEMRISRPDSRDYMYISMNEKATKKSCIQSIAQLKI